MKSIRKFLEKAKKDLKVTSDFNYFNMTMIDAIWFIQNIYQRRNISLEKYIKVMEETKKLVITLLEEIDLDIQSLKKCDLLIVKEGLVKGQSMTKHGVTKHGQAQ